MSEPFRPKARPQKPHLADKADKAEPVVPNRNLIEKSNKSLLRKKSLFLYRLNLF